MKRQITPVQVLHVKVFRAGIGRMGFCAVMGDEQCDPDDGGEHDGEYHATPRQAVDALMADFERTTMLRVWDDVANDEDYIEPGVCRCGHDHMQHQDDRGHRPKKNGGASICALCKCKSFSEKRS